MFYVNPVVEVLRICLVENIIFLLNTSLLDFVMKKRGQLGKKKVLRQDHICE